MKGVRCDRCGKFYCFGGKDKYKAYTVRGYVPYGRGKKTFKRELCRECYDELKEFINNEIDHTRSNKK